MTFDRALARVKQACPGFALWRKRSTELIVLRLTLAASDDSAYSVISRILHRGNITMYHHM